MGLVKVPFGANILLLVRGAVIKRIEPRSPDIFAPNQHRKPYRSSTCCTAQGELALHNKDAAKETRLSGASRVLRAKIL